MPSQLKTIFCCGLFFTSPALAQNISIETPTIKTQGIATTNSVNTSTPSSTGLSTVDQSSAVTVGASTVAQTNASATSNENQVENISRVLLHLIDSVSPINPNRGISESMQINNNNQNANVSENANPVNNSEDDGTFVRIIGLSPSQKPSASSNDVSRASLRGTFIINNEVNNEEITESINNNNAIGSNSSSPLNNSETPDCNVVDISRSVSRVDCR